MSVAACFGLAHENSLGWSLREKKRIDKLQELTQEISREAREAAASICIAVPPFDRALDSNNDKVCMF